MYEAVAWVSMLAGLAVMVGLCLGIRYAWTTALPSISDVHTATLQAVTGTVEVLDRQSSRWAVAAEGQQLHEGDVIRTNPGSHALLTFFDLSTATLYPASQVQLIHLRTNHFSKPLVSTPRSEISVKQSSGRVQYGVAHLNPVSKATFEVTAGNVAATLNEGSYFAKVMADGTFEVVATRGSSIVQNPLGRVAIRGGERTLVHPNGSPEPAILAAEDLVQNGDFVQRTASGAPAKWDLVATPAEARDVPGSVTLESDESQPVIRFLRSGSTYHGETHAIQTINQDVTDYNVVRLEMRFKVMSQSVSGGGEQGSEYPLMVRVNYLDQNGSPAFFVHGFYIQNDKNLPTSNGQQVPANSWVTLIGENGIALQNLTPQPQFIQSIDIQASGHDYASEIQHVALIVE